DRRERAVDVEEDRRAARVLTQAGERVHAHTIRTLLRLAVIGVVAGFFSALFGVGGGLITVPLLLLFTRFEERPAIATSLGAAAIIGVASIAGVEAGVQIATSVPESTLRRLFAVLVFLVAANIAWRRRKG